MSRIKSTPYALPVFLLIVAAAAMFATDAQAQRSTPVTIVNTDPIPVALEGGEYRTPTDRTTRIDPNHPETQHDSHMILFLNGRTFVLKDVIATYLGDGEARIVFAVEGKIGEGYYGTPRAYYNAVFDSTRGTETFHLASGLTLSGSGYVSIFILHAVGNADFQITIAGYMVD